MSRGQKARTVENFPRMKDRAGRRRKRRAWQLLAREGDGDPLTGFCKLMGRIADAAAAFLGAFAEAITTAFAAAPKRDDYSLLPAPLTAEPPLPLRNDLQWNTCPHAYMAEVCTGPNDAHDSEETHRD